MTWPWRRAAALAAAAAVLAAAAASWATAPLAPRCAVDVTPPAGTPFDSLHMPSVPVALDDKTQQAGLSGQLGQQYTAMLFAWPQADYRPFWMVGVDVPLTVLFVDDAGQVIGSSAMVPNSRDWHLPPAPIAAALELPTQVAGHFGVAAGWRLTVEDCPVEALSAFNR